MECGGGMPVPRGSLLRFVRKEACVGGAPLRPASPDTSPRNDGGRKEMWRPWDDSEGAGLCGDGAYFVDGLGLARKLTGISAALWLRVCPSEVCSERAACRHYLGSLPPASRDALRRAGNDTEGGAQAARRARPG
jgi:hypothetical protein